jgi:predicted transcriptional regulator
MDDDKIVLDRKSFEALAVDTRVKILKSLKERRKTLTEIAKEQNMSVSGIKEHLSTLENVGLIAKIDDGHKWKYYELTKKGKDVVGPKEVKVLILLSMSILTLLASLVLILPAQAPLGASQMAGAEPTAMSVQDKEILEDADRAPKESPRLEMVAEPPADTNYAGGEAVNESEGPVWKAEPEEFPVAVVVAAISLLTIAGCVAILARNRMK